MANGTLNAALVTLRVMGFLRKQLPALNTFSTNFKSEAVNPKLNQQVIARVVTVPTVSEYHATNGYVAGQPASVDVPVTITKHKHVTLEFGVEDLSSTDRDLIGEQAAPAAYALGKDLVDAAVGLITPANFATEVVETLANTQRSTLGKLRTQLNLQGAGPMGRGGLLNSTAFEYLTDDAKIVSQEYNPGFQQDNKPTGELLGIKGFERVAEYVDLPTANNLTGFFGTKDSIVIATRVPSDPALVFPELAGAGKIELITDPDTGMSMLVRTHYNWQLGKVHMTLVWMYGVAKGVTGQAVRLVHTANV